MSKNYFLTVDAGTGSVRAVLFDLAGNQTSCVQQEWDHREDPRYPGSMDFDWEYNWKLTCGSGVCWNSPAFPRLTLQQSPPPA